MNRLKFSIVLLSSCLLLSACGDEEQTQVDNNPVPPPQPIPEVDINVNPDIDTDSSPNVSGLIPSTNPQVRLKQINQGKGDPFGVIRPPSVVRVSSNQGLSPSAQNRLKNSAIITRDSGTSGGNSGNNPNPVQVNSGTVLVKGQPAVKIPLEDGKVLDDLDGTNNGNNSQIATGSTGAGSGLDGGITLPLPPQTQEAENIQVSGIIDLQGQNVALVQTPWDGTTRSVRVGDVISDATGSVNVTVKEIYFGSPTDIALQENNGTVFRSLNDADGIVILEQNGTDVTRTVADNVSNSEDLTDS